MATPSVNLSALGYVIKCMPGTLLHALHDTVVYGPKDGWRMLVSLIKADYRCASR